jgi:NADPH-dependent ferric siderophore reductase
MTETPALHTVARLRHETRRRPLTVRRAFRLTPQMMRIEFSSPDLADFVSASPDDHIKLRVPDASAESGVTMRDYTPRAFDVAKGLMTIDFALHEAGQDIGPATAWALSAREGDTVEIGGPRGSAVVPDDFDYYLLVGDETALPSIGRRVEHLRAGVAVTTIVVVDGPAEIQTFETRANWRPLWAFRDGATDDATLLREVVAGWQPPQGDGYVWIAAEATVARALRDTMLAERGHTKAWVKAAGYWVRGEAGASTKMEA